MPFDESFYKKYVNAFKASFGEIFGDVAELVKESCSFEHRGHFELIYNYIPLSYNIIIENEFRSFWIVIEDEEKARTALRRIEEFDSNLNEANIYKALHILKKVLSENKFDLFLHINGKTYRKNRNGLKRVKDIRELM